MGCFPSVQLGVDRGRGHCPEQHGGFKPAPELQHSLTQHSAALGKFSHLGLSFLTCKIRTNSSACLMGWA